MKAKTSLLTFLSILVTNVMAEGALVEFNAAIVPPSAFKVRQAKAKGIELKAEPGTSLTGFLYKPSGKGPFAAVVLNHDCRGIRKYQTDWAEVLKGWGYVVLQVDSYSARDAQDVCANIFTWDTRDIIGGRTYDAQGAMQHLTKLDYVDSKRIAVLGWDRDTTLGTIAAVGMHRDFEQKFKAAVAFYPDCGRISSAEFIAPLLVLAAEKSDWWPPKNCSKLKAAADAKGTTVDIQMYADAQQGFDDPEVGSGRYHKTAFNPHKTPAGGATFAYNEQARNDAIQKVKKFLAEHL